VRSIFNGGHLASASVVNFTRLNCRLWEWVNVTANVPQVIVEKLAKLKANAANFKLTFEYPSAYRTRNTVDRLMNYQDRMLYAMQYFHGSKTAVQQALRAMAML